jgi:hypothetical protein
MRRYFVAPIARWSDQLEAECPDIGMATTVLEPEPLVRRTGLLDASGNDILVEERMGPIGFTRFGSDA